MSCLNRIFRAGLALVLTAPPALAGNQEVLLAAPGTPAAGKAEIASTAEAELNAVEEDDLRESPLAGKETLGADGENKPQGDVADRLAALELDEKEVDDDVDEDPAEMKEVLETAIEAELDSEPEDEEEAGAVEADQIKQEE